MKKFNIFFVESGYHSVLAKRIDVVDGALILYGEDDEIIGATKHWLLIKSVENAKA